MSLRVRRARYFVLLVAIRCVAVARPHAQNPAWTKGLSAAEVTTLVNSGGRRIVDLRADTSAGGVQVSTSPWRTTTTDGRGPGRPT